MRLGLFVILALVQGCDGVARAPEEAHESLPASRAERTSNDIRQSIRVAALEHVTPEEWAHARGVMAARRRTLGRERFPPERYRQFPRSVRNLIRDADIEGALCGGPGNEATESVCERSGNMHDGLEKLGWCWDVRRGTSDWRWMRCAGNIWPIEQDRRFGSL